MEEGGSEKGRIDFRGRTCRSEERGKRAPVEKSLLKGGLSFKLPPSPSLERGEVPKLPSLPPFVSMFHMGDPG